MSAIAASEASALALDCVSVQYGAVRALDNVSLQVRAGEVHGLMGENGAGKSTLLKVLSGVVKPQAGQIFLDGKPQRFVRPRDAIDAGVSIIYQELHLVPELTVAENLLLGQTPSKLGVVNRRALFERAKKELDQLGEPIDPRARVADLSIGQRQMLEIGKALLRNSRVIAFDEPTSSLSLRETQRLMQIIRALRDEGRTIIYVTHRMDEVDEICDRVTVFRDGRHICVMDKAQRIDRSELIAAMIGRRVDDVYGYRPRQLGPVQLEVRELQGTALREPVNLTASQGEIIGLFGLVGAGRTEFAKVLCGVDKATRGEVRIRGRQVGLGSPRRAIAAGIALAPEDRKQDGLVLGASVSDNVNLSCRRHHSRFGFARNIARERATTTSYITRLSIKTPDAQTPVANLSGGNQQKIVLARYLAEHIEVFVLDEPTRGVDVGARKQIYDLLYELAEAGKTLLVISSDIAEVAGISDRVLVMRSGRLVGDLPRAEVTAEKLVRLALPS